jgi:hypothetical protein
VIPRQRSRRSSALPLPRRATPHHLGFGGLRPAIPMLVASLVCLGHLGCDDRPGSLEDWREHRARLDATVWADEVLAQQYAMTLYSLWDALLDADRRGDPASKLGVLTSIDFSEITLGVPQRVEALDHDIESFEFVALRKTLTSGEWAAFLAELAGGGYRLVQSEWHHTRFSPPGAGSPARSRVMVMLHVIDAEGDRRIAVEGELAVEWSDRRDARGHFIPERIDATGLRMLTRPGPPAFERILGFQRPLQGGLSMIHPVLIYDLDKDGFSEIVMVRASRVLWNRQGGNFRGAPLLGEPYALMETALTETGMIADMNGDSHPDLMSTRARGDLVLYLGDGTGRFLEDPKVSPRFEQPLRAPSVIAVGDVDSDGDLDVWLAQYKPPYISGQMPTPYWDANDGYPAYLLLNDGAGGFTPATEAAGLGERRFRRTYASSFVDLDGDHDLDLLTVNDFAGVDLYHNDGDGHFVDANDTLRSNRHLFGMSAAFGDYDLDGRLDFFMAGMASTTAQRMEAMELGRAERPEMQEMRMSMAYGNRMFLAGDDGWREPEFRDDIAHTGWTWGTAALDFDNDGDPDLFAANGNESGRSTKDYCFVFWCHDIYDGESEPNEELGILFGERMRGFATRMESWEGHQKNRLLMNRRGRAFINVAFLLGVADSFDGRSALSEDLDLDGRVDLIVVEDRGLKGQKLHVLRNQLETGNAWIGIQLREEGRGVSPVGASVVVRTAEQKHVGRVFTGETIMGQNSTTLHFGLGSSKRVEAIEIRWADGRARTLPNPEINRYHFVAAPGEMR